MFEGVPSYPAYDWFWDVVEKHRVSVFYTAPTAIRALRREGDEWVHRHDVNSLRLLGTVEKDPKQLGMEIDILYYKFFFFQPKKRPRLNMDKRRRDRDLPKQI